MKRFYQAIILGDEAEVNDILGWFSWVRTRMNGLSYSGQLARPGIPTSSSMYLFEAIFFGEPTLRGRVGGPPAVSACLPVFSGILQTSANYVVVKQCVRAVHFLLGFLDCLFYPCARKKRLQKYCRQDVAFFFTIVYNVLQS